MMAKIARDDDGLTPQEAATAAAHARGLNQSDAYRAGFGGRSKPSTVNSKASTLFAKPQMQGRVRELLRASKIQDVTSAPEHMHKMMTAREAAFEAKNYTAAASWDRTIAQCLAMTSNNVNVHCEGTLTDEQLVSRIAGDNEEVAAVLRAQLGVDSTFH